MKVIKASIIDKSKIVSETASCFIRKNISGYFKLILYNVMSMIRIVFSSNALKIDPGILVLALSLMARSSEDVYARVITNIRYNS